MAYEHFTADLREYIESSIQRMRNPDRTEKIKRVKEKRKEKKKMLAKRFGL